MILFARQTIQYMSRNKVVETELRELANASRGRISSGETDEWPEEGLTVPPLPPTNLRGCHVIRIQYDVFVSTTGLKLLFTSLPVIRRRG